MIYFTLKGGLGNMMFQIAATYSMSLLKETEMAVYDVEQHLNYLKCGRKF